MKHMGKWPFYDPLNDYRKRTWELMREALMAAQVFYIDEINAAVGDVTPGKCRECDEVVPNEKLPWCEHCAMKMVAVALTATHEGWLK